MTENSAKSHIRQRFPKIRGFSKAHTCVKNQDAKLSHFDEKQRRQKIKIQRKKNLDETRREIEKAENDHKMSYTSIYDQIRAIQSKFDEALDHQTF